MKRHPFAAAGNRLYAHPSLNGSWFYVEPEETIWNFLMLGGHVNSFTFPFARNFSIRTHALINSKLVQWIYRPPPAIHLSSGESRRSARGRVELGGSRCQTITNNHLFCTRIRLVATTSFPQPCRDDPRNTQPTTGKAQLPPPSVRRVR